MKKEEKILFWSERVQEFYSSGQRMKVVKKPAPFCEIPVLLAIWQRQGHLLLRKPDPHFLICGSSKTW